MTLSGKTIIDELASQKYSGSQAKYSPYFTVRLLVNNCEVTAL